MFAAGLGGVVIGTAFAWNSAAARLTRTFGNDYAANRESDDSGWYVDTVACYLLGTTVGGLVLGPVTRYIGYRWSVVGCDMVVFIGWLLLSQVNWAPVWASRLAHGVGTGGLGLLIPTYIAHITDFRIRGKYTYAEITRQVWCGLWDSSMTLNAMSVILLRHFQKCNWYTNRIAYIIHTVLKHNVYR